MENEVWIASIIVYRNKENNTVKFEAQKGVAIYNAVKDCISYLRVYDIPSATLTFNEVNLTIKQNSYWQDKVDEYYSKYGDNCTKRIMDTMGANIQ